MTAEYLFEQAVTIYTADDGTKTTVTDKQRAAQEAPAAPRPRSIFEEDVYALMIQMSLQGTPVSYDIGCDAVRYAYSTRRAQ